MSEGLVGPVGTSRRVRANHELRALMPALLLVGILLLVFRETVAAMVGIWSRSDTFAHAFLVPPIALWLIWRQRDQVDLSAARASPMWLLPMLAACLLWLLGQLAGVAAATQFAVMAMVVLVVPIVLGTSIARQLAFPLLFLFFAVPIGDFLVEPMMQGTADFTVLALRLTGIPVYREGLQFVIPSGNWSVVEACSGVRYLIASFMVGTLFAYLNFRSRRRRLAFVVMALAIPVVANWVRAYMIVLLGHYSGNRLAVGADHLIYGWVFFGVVIFIMFAVGARFADVGPTAALPAAGGERRAEPRGASSDRRSAFPSAATAVVLAMGVYVIAWQLEQPAAGSSPRLTLPDQMPEGWVASEPALTSWVPQYAKANAVAARTYRLGGAAVGIWAAHYRDQSFERKLITSTNVLVPQGSAEWLSVSVADKVLRLSDDTEIRLRAALLRTPADPKTDPRQRLLVLQTYRIGSTYVISDVRAKVRLAVQRLLGRGDDSSVLMIFAEADERGGGVEVLERFAAQHLPALAAAADAAAGLR